MPKKIGIFGGTFNPVHNGHLALANYLCEYCGLDELWFMVTPCNPFKKNDILLPDYARLEMVRAAVSGYNKFRASDFEFNLPKPSYTVDTLAALRTAYPDCEFALIIGADNYVAFDKWRNPDEIMRHHSIIVYGRPGYEIDKSLLPPNVTAPDTPLIEISSTFIRQSVSKGLDVRYFVHPEVWKLITGHGYYL